jgi:hypothetical protein
MFGEQAGGGGAELVEEFDDVLPAPVPSSAITCTLEASFEDQGASSRSTGRRSSCRRPDNRSERQSGSRSAPAVGPGLSVQGGLVDRDA